VKNARYELDGFICLSGQLYKTLAQELMGLQEDSEICHSTRATITSLPEQLRKGQLLSRIVDQEVNTTGPFALGHASKAHVYENKPRNIEHLKQGIRRVIGGLD